ncbi:hypothetical protein GYB61_13165 [bacterium]|nr:hypothetical protein [bacterium]
MTLKILRIPALVGISLFATTAAQSLHQQAPTAEPVSVASSVLGAATLIVWQQTGDNSALRSWAETMQVQYAVAGLRVQTLARSAADVRQVVDGHRHTANTRSGLVLFDRAGHLRLAMVRPALEQLSNAEAASQALIAQRDIPGWIRNGGDTRLYRP